MDESQHTEQGLSLDTLSLEALESLSLESLNTLPFIRDINTATEATVDITVQHCPQDLMEELALQLPHEYCVLILSHLKNIRTVAIKSVLSAQAVKAEIDARISLWDHMVLVKQMQQIEQLDE